jgi:phage tail sheath gpL-like
MAFTQIPAGNLVPGAYGEFDKSGAIPGAPPKPHRACVIGIVPAASAAPKATPTAVTSTGQALATFGKTHAGAMAVAYLRKHPRDRLDVIALEEDGAAAAGSIGLTGTATEAGELVIRANGHRIGVPVAVGSTAADLLTASKAAIDKAIAGISGWQLLMTTGTIAADALPITVTFEGEVGNDSTLSVNALSSEKTPAGLTLTVVDFAAGSGSPDIADAIAAFGDTQYDTIAVGFRAGAGLTAIENELEARWGAMVQKDGMAFVAVPGTHGQITTFSGSRNSPYLSPIGAGASPTPSWVWAAQFAAMDAIMHMSPRPRFGQSLPDCRPPLEEDRFSDTERQLLLEDGIATYRVSPGGSVVIERAITSYTQDPASGVPDASYRNASTLRNLAYLRWSWNARMVLKYADANLAPDGTIVNPGVKVVTPSVIKGDAVDWYTTMMGEGRVHSLDAFLEEFSASIDAGDPERLNNIKPVILVAELVTIATKFAFRFTA